MKVHYRCSNHLLADIWASLYKMKPEITAEDVDSVLKVNKSLMERIMADEYFENYRSFTRLDDLSSAIGTVKFGEKTNQWLADQKEEDEELTKTDAGNSQQCKGNFKSRSGKKRQEMEVG